MSFRTSKKLMASEVTALEDILQQCPETMGFRNCIETILNKLAGEESVAPGFRFYIAGDGDVVGTNDQAVADHYSDNEEFYVIDKLEGKWLLGNGEDSAVLEKTL